MKRVRLFQSEKLVSASTELSEDEWELDLESADSNEGNNSKSKRSPLKRLQQIKTRALCNKADHSSTHISTQQLKNQSKIRISGRTNDENPPPTTINPAVSKPSSRRLRKVQPSLNMDMADDIDSEWPPAVDRATRPANHLNTTNCTQIAVEHSLVSSSPFSGNKQQPKTILPSELQKSDFETEPFFQMIRDGKTSIVASSILCAFGQETMPCSGTCLSVNANHAFLVACEWGREDIIRLLLHTITITADHNSTPVQTASFSEFLQKPQGSDDTPAVTQPPKASMEAATETAQIIPVRISYSTSQPSALRCLLSMRGWKTPNMKRLRNLRSTLGSNNSNSSRNDGISDDELFRPLTVALSGYHYAVVALLARLAPCYILHCLKSQASLHSKDSSRNIIHPTSISGKAPDSPEVVKYNTDSEITNSVYKHDRGTGSNADSGADPCLLFQLIRDDWFLGLCVALQSADNAIYNFSMEMNSSNKTTISSKKQPDPQSAMLVSIPASITISADVVRPLRSEAVRSLLRTPGSRDGSTVVHWAAEENLHLCLSQLVRLDPNLISTADVNGLTPLHCACMMGAVESVDALLDVAIDTGTIVDISAPDETGWTPFLYAVYREHVHCALRLLRRRGGNTRGVISVGLEARDESIDSSQQSKGSSASSSITVDERTRLNKLYDTDTARRELKLLGQIVAMCPDGDNRVKAAMEALSTVPEFRQLVNALLFADPDLLDEDLSYLVRAPTLLDPHCKLLVLRKACLLLNYSALERWINAIITPPRPKEAFAVAQDIGSELFPLLSPYRPPRVDEWHLGSIQQILQRGQVDRVAHMCDNVLPSIVKLSRSRPWDDLIHIVQQQHRHAKLNQSLLGRPGDIFRYRMLFQFEGVGEEGAGPGVERELFDLLSSELLGQSPQSTTGSAHSSTRDDRLKYALFRPVGSEDSRSETTSSSSNTAHIHEPLPIPNTGELRARRLLGLEIFGRLLGHMLLRAVAAPGHYDTHSTESSCVNAAAASLLSINLSEPFWCLILGQSDLIKLNHLASVDPMLYTSLTWLRENSGAEALDLVFTTAVHQESNSQLTRTCKGEITSTNKPMRVEPLVPGGENITVTDMNKEEFISATLRKVLIDRQAVAAEAVRKGLLNVVPETVLSLFSHTDLCLLLSGSTEINVSDWKNHSTYEGVTTGDQIVVTWFWRLVYALSSHERSLLLRFCTGTSKLPVGGFASLRPPFKISLMPLDPRRSLPTAATCFCLLRLPRYTSESQLRKQVAVAIIHGSEGFSFV